MPRRADSAKVVARDLAKRAGGGSRTVPPVDMSSLEELVGYNCRRAYQAVLEYSIQPMAKLGLRRSWYSMLVLMQHNPGVSSRELCDALGVQPPNLVGMIAAFEERGLIERRTRAEDRRVLGLFLTARGSRLIAHVEAAVARAEVRATSMLSASERRTLNRLLRRVYASSQSA